MTRPRYNGLSVFAAILLATITGELLVQSPVVDLDGAANGRNGPSPAATAAVPRPTWSAEILLARPLFQPDRRPEASSTVGSIDVPGLAELRLAGIVDALHLKRAVFQPVGTGKAIIVSEGDRLGDWTVTAIDATAVTIAHGSDIRRLRPRFAVAGAAAQPPPAGATPTPARPIDDEVLGSIGVVQIPPRPFISDRP